MRIALCQINSTVGDIEKNAQLIAEQYERAASAGAHLIVFPELALQGYPAEDLLIKPQFIERSHHAIKSIAADMVIPTLIGTVHKSDDKLFNAAAIVAGGSIRGYALKRHLPNYDVFDEQRWFTAATEPTVIDIPDGSGSTRRIGISICEDIWVDDDVVGELVEHGAQVIANLSASPYKQGRTDSRWRLLQKWSDQHSVPIAYCNLAGGQDELVFDGNSLVTNASGDIIATGATCVTDLVMIDIDADNEPCIADNSREAALSELWAVLKLGLHDYATKNGFSDVLLGMSGGIDSALTAALAVDALGSEQVRLISMPSRHSSTGTREDARAMAERLGTKFDEVSIEDLRERYATDIAGYIDGGLAGIADENLQARIRGNIVMAISNAEGQLVLATGNKSEYAVGYSTLYGDMCGGYAPIKDVYKTLVFELARWRNAKAEAAGLSPVIPVSIIDRPPSAELRDEQRDDDSLPPYEVLDAVLEQLIDHDASPEQVVDMGFDAGVVSQVARLVDRAEYKRRQSAPGIRVTGKSFGRDRRVPITNRFTEKLLVQ